MESIVKSKQFLPITVEKQVQQTNANDLNNNLNASNLNNNLNANDSDRKSDELADDFKDKDKYERISELIIKNENLRQFLEKITRLQHTMSDFHKLNELSKLINQLTEHQSELTNESVILRREVDELKELNCKLNQLFETKNRQDLVLQRTESINEQFKYLVDEYGKQNLEIKQSYNKLLNGLKQSSLLLKNDDVQ